MKIDPQDRADLLRDALDLKRRKHFEAAERQTPPISRRTLLDCLEFLDAVQELHRNPPSREVSSGGVFKL